VKLILKSRRKNTTGKRKKVEQIFSVVEAVLRLGTIEKEELEAATHKIMKELDVKK